MLLLFSTEWCKTPLGKNIQRILHILYCNLSRVSACRRVAGYRPAVPGSTEAATQVQPWFWVGFRTRIRFFSRRSDPYLVFSRRSDQDPVFSRRTDQCNVWSESGLYFCSIGSGFSSEVLYESGLFLDPDPVFFLKVGSSFSSRKLDSDLERIRVKCTRIRNHE